jgi:hypothetical protein
MGGVGGGPCTDPGVGQALRRVWGVRAATRCAGGAGGAGGGSAEGGCARWGMPVVQVGVWGARGVHLSPSTPSLHSLPPIKLKDTEAPCNGMYTTCLIVVGLEVLEDLLGALVNGHGARAARPVHLERFPLLGGLGGALDLRPDACQAVGGWWETGGGWVVDVVWEGSGRVGLGLGGGGVESRGVAAGSPSQLGAPWGSPWGHGALPEGEGEGAAHWVVAVRPPRRA